MKITRLVLEGFRAFDAPFELDLFAGKNLLLHGENGSGKSSIYFALKRFFERQGDDIIAHRNQFAPAARSPRVTVHVSGCDSAGSVFDEDVNWNSTEIHPLRIPEPGVAILTDHQRATLVDAAQRAGFLDYRAMLRTHLLSSPLPRAISSAADHLSSYEATGDGLDRQLFDLVTRVILAGTTTTVGGGRVERVGELIDNVWRHRPQTWHRRVLETANQHANTFNSGFNAKLQELQTKFSEFLNYFDNHGLMVNFQPVSLGWDKATRSLGGAQLRLDVTFRGRQVADHHQFLNEARLSAIAVCLFLAGVALADNDTNNPNHPRFLVLDDALIGLDFQNRIPILRILKSDTFKHHQIFLFTHDRVWYDLARGHLPTTENWLHLELSANETPNGIAPTCRPSETDLDRAWTHLASGDLMASAVYARAAFEKKLRNVCEKNGIEVKYKKDNKEISADDLWQGILARQRARVEFRRNNPGAPDFLPHHLQTDIETMRSTVLNQLSHAGAGGLVRADVEVAIRTVEAFDRHNFAKVR
jgi:energy-coupling factor transporter ATP-binding protein EcfA2